MAYENIIFESSDGIATITFNRPKALNALNDALLKEFSQALDDIAENEDVRVLILTGGGKKLLLPGQTLQSFQLLIHFRPKPFRKKVTKLLINFRNWQSR